MRFRERLRRVGTALLQPVANVRILPRVRMVEPLVQLGEEGVQHATLLRGGGAPSDRRYIEGGVAIAAEVGELAGRLVGGDALGDPPQVLDQDGA